ncbi:conserved hypothetical protein [Ricinus communis]|uniref:Glycosyl transferase 64 domain-containing protein n=1 Tax=Ricinus communis TaxID=3988 RepID=B9R9K7_RICCO|nr:conserved hypothetical protein [Ricinus communis]
MSTLRDLVVDDLYSPAKEKAADKSSYNNRWTPLQRRIRHLLAAAKFKLLLGLCVLCVAVFMTSKISFLMDWIPEESSSFSSPSKGGYTVLINTWKRNSLLKHSVALYASCGDTVAIHAVWGETDPPLLSLKAYFKRIVFKPIANVKTDAFSVDDDVIVPCSALDFALSVRQTAPSAMVGFIPRMHLLDSQKNGVPYYKYGGWWSVWWTGAYSMVLSIAAFFHKKYLDLYAHTMPKPIQDYVARERNCEDIAMSFLVANSTGAPPIWVKEMRVSCFNPDNDIVNKKEATGD